MKTLRFIGMAVVAIIMSVNFIACSDDDDDAGQLEGTWGLTHSAGWHLEHRDGAEKNVWDFTCDPYNPNENDGDNERLVIKKLTDNTYSVTSTYFHFSYEMGKPTTLVPDVYGSNVVTINGNSFTITKNGDDNFDGCFNSYATYTIESLTSDKLVIRKKYDNVPDDVELRSCNTSGDIIDTYIRME